MNEGIKSPLVWFGMGFFGSLGYLFASTIWHLVVKI